MDRTDILTLTLTNVQEDRLNRTRKTLSIIKKPVFFTCIPLKVLSSEMDQAESRLIR